MNRIQLFKYMRQQHQKIAITFLVSILIMAVGLYIVDYSVNTMMGLENKSRIIIIENKTDGIYEISFMNHSNKINLTYVQKDIDKVNSFIKNSYITCRQYVDEFSNRIHSVTNIE